MNFSEVPTSLFFLLCLLCSPAINGDQVIFSEEGNGTLRPVSPIIQDLRVIQSSYGETSFSEPVKLVALEFAEVSTSVSVALPPN